jgi:2-dehydropantoate 2-reductase
MLARAGADVAFVARGATRARLRATGVTVTTPDGGFDAGPFEVEEDPAALAPADAVFVATKSFQVAALAAGLAPLVAGGGVVVPLQNGVEAAEQLASALGAARVLGGLCHVLAQAVAPGEVKVSGGRLRVTFGELAGPVTARARAIGDALAAAGVAVDVADDVRVELWEKLLFVGPMGLVGAATGLTADRYRGRPDTRALLEEAMNEVARVAQARGVSVRADAVASALARLDSLPAGASTSMQKDLLAKRPSEIEEQIGAVVRSAAAHGVDAPVHRALYAVLKARAEA